MSRNTKQKKQKSAKSTLKSVQSVVAKSDDGSIQITFTVPFEKIKLARNKAIEELGKNIDVPGFRKGKAPKDVVKNHIQDSEILEKALSTILPNLVSDTVKKENLEIVIYPKFKLVKAKEGEAWEIRAETAEIPEVKLGKYKENIQGAIRSKNLWVPGKKGDKKVSDPEGIRPGGAKKLSREEKEQEIINTLLETIKVKVPKILIDEETNSKLSKLLERLEKLGLNLDSYLASVGKKADELRAEYEKQAQQSLGLDIILGKIADEDNIKIKDSEIDAAIKATGSSNESSNKPEQESRRKLIRSILRKRAALNSLVEIA